jgi:hypothetical protein
MLLLPRKIKKRERGAKKVVKLQLGRLMRPNGLSVWLQTSARP